MQLRELLGLQNSSGRGPATGSLPIWSARFCIVFLGRECQCLTISVVGVQAETQTSGERRFFPFPVPFCPRRSMIVGTVKIGWIQVPLLTGPYLIVRALENYFIPLSFCFFIFGTNISGKALCDLCDSHIVATQ